MDFAVTSPLQLSMLAGAAQQSLAAAASYEGRKFSDRDTAQRCSAQGIRLVPAIAESFGGWGHEAQKAFKVIARATSARTGVSVSAATSQLYEGLGVRLVRAAAASLLKRVSSLDAGLQSACPAQAALAATAGEL